MDRFQKSYQAANMAKLKHHVTEQKREERLNAYKKMHETVNIGDKIKYKA